MAQTCDTLANVAAQEEMLECHIHFDVALQCSLVVRVCIVVECRANDELLFCRHLVSQRTPTARL